MPNSELSINELLMLLALDDREGSIHWDATPYLDYALAGGALSELAAVNAIAIDNHGYVSTGDQVPDLKSRFAKAILQQIQKSEESRKVGEWVGIIANVDNLAQQQMAELVTKGILEQKEESFLFFFHRKRYPARDMTPEKQIIKKIRDSVLGDEPVEPRLAVLICLANGAHLLSAALSPEEIDQRQARIREISQGLNIGQAACRQIKDAERALFVASSIPFMGIPQL